MACPDCCAGIPGIDKKQRRFFDWKYIEHSARYFKGMNINLTGGEASIHPQFEEFIPKMKALFEAPVFSIWTNGTMFKKKADAFRYFDVIHVTRYTKDMYPGCIDNGEQIEFIREYLKNTPIPVNVAEITHQKNQGPNMCFRGYTGSVEYVDGYIYPCCAASGTRTKTRIPLAENWNTDILTVKPACHECVFGEA